jgi:hypothetical protein
MHIIIIIIINVMQGIKLSQYRSGQTIIGPRGWGSQNF